MRRCAILVTWMAPGCSIAAEIDPADLSRLHDFIEPPAVSFWPPAPGWYVLMAVAAYGALAWLVRKARQYRANAYRRAALAEIEALHAHTGPGRRIAGAAEILKRTALVAYPRSNVASLSGEAWVEWLNRVAGETIFGPGTAEVLLQGLYRKQGSGDQDDSAVNGLLEAVCSWIRRHPAPEKDEPS